MVYNKFPIPLINRMEKHFLVISSGLTEAQKQVTKKLNTWVENFAEVFQQQHENRRLAEMLANVIFYLYYARALSSISIFYFGGGKRL